MVEKRGFATKNFVKPYVGSVYRQRLNLRLNPVTQFAKIQAARCWSISANRKYFMRPDLVSLIHLRRID